MFHFYLFKDLHHMAGFVRVAKHPYSSLTHHELIKLLILRALAQRNQTWEQFTGQPHIAQGPILFPEIPIREEIREPKILLGVQLEEEQEDQSPSNLVGGVVETGSKEEEELAQDVAVANPIEEIENLGAPVAEAEAGATLDVVTAEVESVGAVVT